METWMIVVVEAVALPIVASIAWVVLGRRQSPSFVVKAAGIRSRTGAPPASRTKRVDRFEIHPLSAGERDRFLDRWRSTQASFVDNPAGAVSEAQMLLEDVMRARGYRVDDFDQRAGDISVDHPRFIENYREACDLAVAGRRGPGKTEDLRRATVRFRSLVEDLLRTND